MKKRFAIPLLGNVLSSHFGQCNAFAFVDVENEIITKMVVMDPPEHLPGTYPRWVAANGATDVLAGGMGQQAVDLFNQQGINVFVGAPVQSAEALVTTYLQGNLKLSANYCNHDGDHHHDHGHHHN